MGVSFASSNAIVMFCLSKFYFDASLTVGTIALKTCSAVLFSFLCLFPSSFTKLWLFNHALAYYRSANIGVFICLKCCGVHRSLGTHISKVRSLFASSSLVCTKMAYKYVCGDVISLCKLLTQLLG